LAGSRILVEDYAGVTVVTPTDGALIDSSVIDQMAKDLYHLVDVQNKQRLVVDFSNVKLLGSHALGVLLTLLGKSKQIKGKLALCGLRKELQKVFTLTGLDKQFAFYADDAAALLSFGVRVD
jgi:anti-anti-sigma factor